MVRTQYASIVLFFAGFQWVSAAEPVRVEYAAVARALVEERLHCVSHKIERRRAALEAMFEESGCTGGRLSRQPVNGTKHPNVICSLPGGSEGVIVVSAHYDLADRGIGAVDNWSGTVLLPCLHQSLHRQSRRHTFQFVGFTGEEKGLLGSRAFVKNLSPEEKARIRAVVNLECLGLSPPKVWLSAADGKLAGAYAKVSRSLRLPPAGVSMDKVGADDTLPFRLAKLPTLSIHSVTRETLPILHSVRDRVDAINLDHYYDAYRLAAVLLAYLDAVLE